MEEALPDRQPTSDPGSPDTTAAPIEPAPIVTFPELRRRTPAPVVPWHPRAQRLVREATQPGRIEAEHDVRIEALLRQIATRPHIVGVIGPKGGAGKSTTALLLGLVLAQYPAARPVLCEVNPDWGTLSELLGQPITRTIVDVLRDYTAIDRAGIGLLQGYQTMFGRLPVLTVPKDPEVMARLAPRDYDRVLQLLSVHYGLLLLDCGTGLTQRLNQYAIQNADHLVVVGWPEQATMRMTLGAVEYLASSRYEHDYRGVLAESARRGARPRPRRHHPRRQRGRPRRAGGPGGPREDPGGGERPQRRRRAAPQPRAPAAARRRDADDRGAAGRVPAGHQAAAGRGPVAAGRDVSPRGRGGHRWSMSPPWS